MYLLNKIKVITILTLLQFYNCYPQKTDKPAIESFESKEVLHFYEAYNSTLSISEERRRFGKTALQWDLKEKAFFGTSNFRKLSREESPLKYGDFFPSSPTFILSIYNETPKKEKVTFSFEEKGNIEVWFDIELSFKGWRRIWVPFYEMEGNAPKRGAKVHYDYFKVSSTAQGGKLFFDDIIFSQYQDDRHAYPDLIVPFIKSDKVLGADHWMPLIKNLNLLKSIEVKPISMAIKLDLLKFQNQIDKDLEIHKKYKLYMNTLKELYATLKLEEKDQVVLGPPLTYKLEQEYFNKKQQGHKIFNDIHDFGKVIKKLANFYGRADQEQAKQIKKMFLTASKYFLDQGWQAGASGGTRHHIGYGIRDLTEGFYIMRNVLKEEGLLKNIGLSLQWLHNLGGVLGNSDEFSVNIDYLNTQSYYHLMIIFLEENQERQAALLKAYSNYISITLAQEDKEWGFKPDGTVWHHNGHYPAYGLGAFKTVPKIIRTLSGTRYRIRAKAHKNFKKAFLATKDYSQLYDFGFGNAGRHPLDNGDITSLKKQYLQMAYSGNPEGTSKIDKQLAASYLRLWGHKDKLHTSIFTDVNNISKEVLSGYKTFPYAATAVHRRNNWAAVIKGYSKYVWSSEIYVASNRYGRYPANGTIQLLNEKGERGSGFIQEGWDWNRYPGSTIIYLPFEELEPETPLIMFRSNETFVGATELDGNGVFGMILNESKGDNADGSINQMGFPGKLKAKKSVFSFGKKLICIGTNISSVDTKNPVQTNLFQTALLDNKRTVYSSSKILNKISSEEKVLSDSKSKKWLIDPYGNGYHILSNATVKVKIATQNSYHNKYSIRTGKMNPKGKGVKETKGDFASAWVEHGIFPKNESYQYVIYPSLNADKIHSFSKDLLKKDSYVIKRTDSIAHIVFDTEKAITAYVIFDGKHNLEEGLLKSASSPSIVMLREKVNEITISAVQPDLNFFKNDQGKYINYSNPVNLTLNIKGEWNVLTGENVISTHIDKGLTKVTIKCRHGVSNYIKLKKI